MPLPFGLGFRNTHLGPDLAGPRMCRRRFAPRPRLERLEERQCLSGYLLITSFDTHNVLRYDGTTGAFVDEFVPRKSGRLNQPNGLAFGPHDHDLYVTSGLYGGPGRIRGVLRFDGTTGTYVENFAGKDELSKPGSILFGPDGNLYVADHVEGATTNSIRRYDTATGEFLGDFVATNSGGLRNPQGMVFGPAIEDGQGLDLYVASARNGMILRYDGTTGAFLGEFVASGVGGLDHPIGLTFGPDGNLYVADGDTRSQGAILRFQGPAGDTPGAFIDSFVPAGEGGLRSSIGVIFGPDGNGDGQQDLYVSNVEYSASYLSKEHTSSIRRYDGVTGAFIDTFVAEDSGGLDGGGYLVFTETNPTTLMYEGATSRTVSPLTASAAREQPASSKTIPHDTTTSIIAADIDGPRRVVALPIGIAPGNEGWWKRSGRLSDSELIPDSPDRMFRKRTIESGGRPRRSSFVKDLARGRIG